MTKQYDQIWPKYDQKIWQKNMTKYDQNMTKKCDKNNMTKYDQNMTKKWPKKYDQ
jgi:regulator of sigma D